MGLLKDFFKDYNAELPVYEGTSLTIPHTNLPKEVDTLVVGGGLSGLSTAVDLASTGRDVLVLDARFVGEKSVAASQRSGGQFWPGFGQSYSDLEKKHGHNMAKAAWSMVHDTLDVVHERIALREDRCDFQSGVLLAAKTRSQADWVQKEAEAMQRAGLDFVTYVEQDEIKTRFVNTDHYYNAMLYEGSKDDQKYGHINPRKYTQTVAKLALDNNVQIKEQCAVQSVEFMQDGRYRVSTPEGEVIAKNIVMASGAEMIRPKGMGYDVLPNAFAPAQTVIVATEPIHEQFAREMIPGDACFFDATNSGMSYGRLVKTSTPEYYRFALGGADAIGQIQTAFDIAGLKKEMRTMFPQLDRAGVKIEKIWGGRCDLTRDDMPYILTPRDGMYVVGGFSGQGMVNTALYGGTVAKAIKGDDEQLKFLQNFNPQMYAHVNGAPTFVNSAIAMVQAARMLIPEALELHQEMSKDVRSGKNGKPLSDAVPPDHEF